MRLGQGQMVYTAGTLWTLREELLLLVAKNNTEIPYFSAANGGVLLQLRLKE